MNATWIVSANASRARFFSQEKPSEDLEEVNNMVNGAVRLRTEDTETDKIGPTAATKSIHNTGGQLPNKQYEPAQTPDERAAEMFARDIAGYLLQSHREGKFKQLSLVASPQFLGVLRKLLDPQLASVVNLQIDKDYTQFSPAQLREQIQSQMRKH